MHLGEKIKEIRRHQGLSQENIAHELGCSVATISRIERGMAECSADMLRDIKAAMGIENAPLIDAETVVFHERLFVWAKLMIERRMDDAHDLSCELAVIRKLPYEKDLIMLYDIFAAGLELTKGNFDEGSKMLDELGKSLDSMNGECRFYYYRGCSTLAFRRDDGELALDYALKALVLKEHCRHLASLYYSIAVDYAMLNRPFQAIMYLNEAKAHHNDDPLSVLGVFIEHVLSENLLRIGETARAKHILDSALLRAEAIGRKLGRKKYIGMILHQLGIYHRKRNELEQALNYFNRSFEFFWEGGTDWFENYYQKARCLIAMKCPNEAREVIETAIKIDGNSKYITMLTGLIHIITLREVGSQDYLENVTIPQLISKHENFIALDFCEQLEEQYKKSGNGKKPLEIAATARDIYARIMFGVQT
ncbi:MAG: helix-turn-helix domain-containing protein [Defluviitaleaceae bacterium]|nr:helix-turn-helix domain-containing protein [Defluviitaleaceae bacterium]